ncbi:uncharacterized protein LOC131646718 [Vicia villosa]|uniref:uncharacterized protein LOC131646718 n=1 Tax=Vicia villosa TaxID=3911 RepID=UPI00273B91C1|nr:uncharacterized protein LOC131646718 [Vicia villosa]
MAHTGLRGPVYIHCFWVTAKLDQKHKHLFDGIVSTRVQLNHICDEMEDKKSRAKEDRLKAIQAQPIMGYWDMENCRLDSKKTKQLAQNVGSAMRNANLNGA